jgi:hypothetical protein
VKVDASTAMNVVERYQRGQSLAYINYATDVPQTTIRRVIVEAGVPIRPTASWGKNAANYQKRRGV